MPSSPPPPVPLLISILGWLGMLLILAAYLAISHLGLSSSSAIYHLLNLAGSLGVATICIYRRTWPALVLELAWALIATLSLLTP